MTGSQPTVTFSNQMRHEHIKKQKKTEKVREEQTTTSYSIRTTTTTTTTTAIKQQPLLSPRPSEHRLLSFGEPAIDKKVDDIYQLQKEHSITFSLSSGADCFTPW
jgi:hypothetical protein